MRWSSSSPRVAARASSLKSNGTNPTTNCGASQFIRHEECPTNFGLSSGHPGTLNPALGGSCAEMSSFCSIVSRPSARVGSLSAPIGSLSAHIGYLSARIRCLSAHFECLSARVRYLSLFARSLCARVSSFSARIGSFCAGVRRRYSSESMSSRRRSRLVVVMRKALS